ncbi:DEAD/DEAH box helicase [Nigerium massiliense]|uniref:DEAD/DEAH box helicase n=1 Tax=Nigerium massiliense TaxID=1522317 RepID=UPI00058E71CD|nr:DEAD/DEAH box helicase [Nigerium massiliense]
MPATGGKDPDALYDAFVGWVGEQDLTLYPHQDEALIDVLAGANVIVTTPTGSGKSMIATAAHFVALASGGRTYYTAPIKALVSEKFFALCATFGAELVGMVTGDASVNPDAPIVCCTAEILANIALREGRGAEVDQVIMDEFHFIADPDRGWAWQVPLVELPQAQFVIMSATLGDVTGLASALERTTQRTTSVIGGVTRPVPLVYNWAMTPLHDTVAEILESHQAPVYIVHSTQAAAVERAQALLSSGIVDKSRRAALNEALRGFTFAGGFGQTLSKLLHAGVAVHHAGMLPRYRRLVEQLAQRGLLAIICGTDTLGVGINVPIRTVLFASLSKFDGRRQRILRSREFHQIAGRAGRAGYDTVGYVVAQAPEHEVENARIVAKHANDPKKLKSVRRKKPPEGFVNYTEATFSKLIESEPEELHARMRVTHGMLLNLLQRDEDTGDVLMRLIDSVHPDLSVRRRLIKRAAGMGRALIAAGVVRRLDEPTPGGRRYALAVDLQRDFALNQPLSAFALAAMERLDDESPTFALDVVSVIESTLEDPRTVLVQQQFRARGETVAELKADGYDYEERVEILDEVTWPRPLADELDEIYTAYVSSHPWLLETPVSPKSVVRDMFERAMTFGEYVAFYKVQRSEGLLLRYLSDAYRALRQTVPEGLRTDELTDIIEWLGQVTRLTDSSLLDEWAELTAMSGDVADTQPEDVAPPTRPVTGNARAFRVLVRNAMFRRVELCADDDVDALAQLETGQRVVMTRKRWDDALGDYWDEHDEIGTGPDARGPAMLVITERGRTWDVRQIIDDPEGNRDWSIEAVVDLDECDESGELVVHTMNFSRLDG